MRLDWDRAKEAAKTEDTFNGQRVYLFKLMRDEIERQVAKLLARPCPRCGRGGREERGDG